MELKEIKPTAAVTIETEDGTLIFTVEHISDARFELDYLRTMRVSERVIAILSDAIVAWNLAHDDGTPWECTPELKPRLLGQIAGKKTKRVIGPDGKDLPLDDLVVGLALTAFVRDEENFLKN